MALYFDEKETEEAPLTPEQEQIITKFRKQAKKYDHGSIMDDRYNAGYDVGFWWWGGHEDWPMIYATNPYGGGDIGEANLRFITNQMKEFDKQRSEDDEQVYFDGEISGNGDTSILFLNPRINPELLQEICDWLIEQYQFEYNYPILDEQTYDEVIEEFAAKAGMSRDCYEYDGDNRQDCPRNPTSNYFDPTFRCWGDHGFECPVDGTKVNGHADYVFFDGMEFCSEQCASIFSRSIEELSLEELKIRFNTQFDEEAREKAQAAIKLREERDLRNAGYQALWGEEV